MRKDTNFTCYTIALLCFIGTVIIFIVDPSTVHTLCMVVCLLQVINMHLNTDIEWLQITIFIVSLLLLGQVILSL